LIRATPWLGAHGKALIIDRRGMVTSGSAGVQQRRLRPLYIVGSRPGVFKALAGREAISILFADASQWCRR
jgi:hypothetical protein